MNTEEKKQNYKATLRGAALDDIAKKLFLVISKENPSSDKVEIEYLKPDYTDKSIREAYKFRSKQHKEIIKLDEETIKKTFEKYHWEAHLRVAVPNDKIFSSVTTIDLFDGELYIKPIKNDKPTGELYVTTRTKNAKEVGSGFHYITSRIKCWLASTFIGQFIIYYAPKETSQKMQDAVIRELDKIIDIKERPLYSRLEKYVPIQQLG